MHEAQARAAWPALAQKLVFSIRAQGHYEVGLKAITMFQVRYTRLVPPLFVPVLVLYAFSRIESSGTEAHYSAALPNANANSY